MRTKWQIGLAAVGSVIVGIAAVFLYRVPLAGAYLCPTCYGFSRIAPGIYDERTATSIESRALLTAIAEAEPLLANVYMKTKAPLPVIFACKSHTCYTRLRGGRDKAAAFANWAIRVSPEGRNTTILTHELAHVELYERLGSSTLYSSSLPTWFDEGLAVMVSRDERYLTTDAAGKLLCKTGINRPLPEDLNSWIGEAEIDHQTLYAQAGCRVLTWWNRENSPRAVINLIDALRSGKTFATVFPVNQ